MPQSRQRGAERPTRGPSASKGEPACDSRRATPQHSKLFQGDSEPPLGWLITTARRRRRPSLSWSLRRSCQRLRGSAIPGLSPARQKRRGQGRAHIAPTNATGVCVSNRVASRTRTRAPSRPTAVRGLVGMPEPVRDGVCTGGSRRAAHRRGRRGRPAWRRRRCGRASQDSCPRTQAGTDARRREWRAQMHQPTPRRAQPVQRRQPGLRQVPATRRSDEDERRAPSTAARADD